jgi:hypothetical protein
VLQFPYTEAVVKEALRLYPPATMLNRQIPAGGLEVVPGVSHEGFGWVNSHVRTQVLCW